MDSIDSVLSSHYQEKAEAYRREYNFDVRTKKKARISDAAN
jgi:hypothetical protein